MEGELNISMPVTNTEPNVSSQGQESQESTIEIEEKPHTYFWKSQQIEEKLHEMASFGSKYGFSGLDLEEISRLVAVQNLERLENRSCICDSFMMVQWKRVKDEFGYEIPKKFVRKFKELMNAMQAIWNENHSSKFEECYCKHILTGLNVEKRRMD